MKKFLLLHLCIIKKTNLSVKFLAFSFLIFISPNNIKAQVANQVLWVRADKGVNSSAGVPTATNTQITTWYDQATSDGIQNGGVPTAHPGQSEPNLPVLPYYKYSSSTSDNFNHNPVINFSYLNYGNAVQFTTPALGSQTVFTVFRAAGTGYYYDAMLLYGGDISNPSMGESTPRADMAFSVWTTSRLNVWGGSVGDFYGLGNLKLETQISIGTLKRNRVSDENVTHSIFGNGSTDILNINSDPDNTRTGEGRYLSSMVRIGKHFSGPTDINNPLARLDGQFAELIVYNSVLTDADRAKVESYLAVKYGITLTGGTRLLGSTVGNSSYPYVNSSGTTIRPSDATYKYDVFGLGRDDYFGLDQRISKSNNRNDILTASTNSNFTSLNLDKTRTAINGDKEFVLFANNKGSSIAVTTQTTELPTDVTSRLDREWKVNYSNTDGSNIQNVSLKFDLSGFTFTGATFNNLKLLIDTDGDGDFTTGTVLNIPASAFVSDSYVSFDNINLTNGNIFTLGILTNEFADACAWRSQIDGDWTNYLVWEYLDCETGEWVDSPTPPNNDRPIYVFDDVNLNTTDVIVADSLFLKPGGNLSACGSLTIDNQLVFEIDQNGLAGQLNNCGGCDGGTVYIEPDATMIARKTLDGTWDFISFPFEVTAANTYIAETDDLAKWGGLESKLIDNVNFIIAEYDGTARASATTPTLSPTQSKYFKSALSPLSVGTGYIITGGLAPVPHIIDFKAAPNTQLNFCDLNISQPYTASVTCENNAGWSLAGNPYSSTFNLNYATPLAPYYVWVNGAYVTVPSATYYPLSPFSAFFLQTTAITQILNFDAEGLSDFSQPVPIPSYDLYLQISQSTLTDQALIRLKDGAVSEYNKEDDAVKIFSSNSSVPQIYFEAQGACTPVGVKTVPMSTQKVDLKIKTGKPGFYNIKLLKTEKANGFNSVQLVDDQTGIYTELLTGESYTYESSTAGVTDRFHVLLATGKASGVHPTQNNGLDISIKGNKVYVIGINGEAQVGLYDVVGKQIYRQTGLQNNQSFTVNTQGVFILDVNAGAQTGRFKILIENNR